MNQKHLLAGVLFLLSSLDAQAYEDFTDYITNPDFTYYYYDKSLEGWTIDVPGGQNVGYQGSTWSNSATSVRISGFAEAWVPTPKTLGEGSISQDLSDLPNGKYILEVDAVACNQQTGAPTEGVYLFGESDNRYEVRVETDNKQPEHFSCTFLVTNGTARIGMRTEAMTNINWMAFDNVKLYYQSSSTTIGTLLTLSQTSASMGMGEELTFTATVNDDISHHIEWASSDESVVSVNSRGQVTALKAGTATITAKAMGTTLSASAQITVKPSDYSKIVINEIQVANLDMFIDPSFNYGGWVELYNPSSQAISLGNIYVSDDPNDLKKHQLPANQGIIPAGGYQNLWFDHYDEKGGKEFSDDAYKQVPFKLAYEGGVIYISDPEGNLICSQEYPAAKSRVSYARTTNGGSTWGMTATPTPEASNASSAFAAEMLAAPEVDVDATVFNSPLTVHVTIPAGTTLRYTTDGTTPTEDNGYVSTDGIFDTGYASVVYRFRLFQDGYLPSEVVTRTYIYDPYGNYYLPIISVVTDRRHLYDDEIGVYTIGTNGVPGNGRDHNTNKNRGWERPVNFEYLMHDEGAASYIQILSQECDLEVCGGWTRNGWTDKMGWNLESTANASFRLKSGKYYQGQNFFPYNFYDSKPFIKSKAIQVRNGGNDYHGRIKDAGLHEIILRSGFYVDCQATQPAHLFINGEYVMMFNIREPNNKNHGYSNYGIDTDEMDQFEINGTYGYQQKAGTDEAFKRWWHLTQDLASDPTDESIYNQICDLVDIDEFCNYMALECVVGCSDWLANSNNVKGYRSTVDGKFHLVFMDVDAGFAYTDMLSRLQNCRYMSKPNNEGGVNYLVDMLLNMLKYEPFRKRFIDAFCIVDGSVYEPTFSRQVFDDMVERAAPAMALESNESNMRSSASSMCNKISNNRDTRMSVLKSYFGLSNEKYVSLASNLPDAKLSINGQEVPRNTFNGRLYAPVVLKADSPAGYRFKGWTRPGGETMVTGTGTTIFDASGETWYYYSGSYRYEFDEDEWKTDDSFDWWSTGTSPLGYGNIGKNEDKVIDYQTTLSYGDDSNNKYPSYFFLKTFNLNDSPDASKVYRLTCYVDDGCVVYVNGNEVGRYHISDNVFPNYYTLTGSNVYEGGLAKEVTFDIPVEYLYSGENIIAASVHNCTVKSSDIYWSAGLKCYDTEVLDDNIVSTSETLDLKDINETSLTLTATFEPLPDEQRLEDLGTPLKVNEVSAANSIFVNDYFKKNDWIELYNPTDTDLDAAGLYVSDDVDDPFKYQIPTGTLAPTTVPAHGQLIVWADKLDAVTQIHAPFKLSNDDGQLVVITSSKAFAQNNAAFFEAHPTLKDFADGLIYTTHRGDQSVGRYPDGANTYHLMARPTIAKSNSLLSFDTVVGTDPGFMNASTDEGFTLDLAKGWNWVSHPLTESVDVNLFKNHADRILGQTLEAYYSSENNAMQGLLKTLSPVTLYKFDMNTAHTYLLSGSVPTDKQTLSLRAGWNWIGCPGSATLTLTDALQGARVEEGDIIMGQSGFSTYSSDNGWVGSLSTLVPGLGYMYKSNTTKSLRFNAAASTLRMRRAPAATATAGTDQVVDRHAYPNVMGVIAQLQCNGKALDAELFQVRAYADGECRGASQSIDGHLFMTLYGNDGDHLTFKAVDETGTAFPVQQTMTFTSDVRGSLAAPLLFTLGDATVIGIAQPTSDTARQVSGQPLYYSLSGLFAGTDARHLAPGLYLSRQGGTCKKVIIR